MDIEQAINIYHDEIWARFAASDICVMLDCIRSELASRGIDASDIDFERTPEGTIWIDAHRRGDTRAKRPEVRIQLTLADSLDREGETEGPYKGVDILLEVSALGEHGDRRLLTTYATGPEPVWTTDRAEISRRCTSFRDSEIAELVQKELERNAGVPDRRDK